MKHSILENAKKLLKFELARVVNIRNYQLNCSIIDSIFSALRLNADFRRPKM